MTTNDIIFKNGDRVSCPVYGYGTVVTGSRLISAKDINPFITGIEVEFDSLPNEDPIEYTYDGRLNQSANITLYRIDDQFEGLPEWVNYIAEDENGDRWGFHSEPYTKDIFNSWEVAENDSTCTPLPRINKNWKSSLIKRHQ